MRAYGKEWSYNVFSCEYCLYWRGRKRGCVLKHGCCCRIPQKPPARNGKCIHYPKEESVNIHSPVSECEECPYGKAAPCIGWCTKKIMTAGRK